MPGMYQLHLITEITFLSLMTETFVRMITTQLLKNKVPIEEIDVRGGK